MGTGLLRYVAAGAASGIAKGVVEGIRQDGLLKREQALERMRGERRSGEAAKRRRFDTSEREADQIFTASEAESARRHKTGMLANTERFQDKTGAFWLRGPDGKAMPLKDETGKQIIGPLKSTTEGLAEVYDPESPTKTTYVPKSKAVGKPGKTGAKEAAEAKRQDDERLRSEARDQAEREASSKAGWWSSDKTDFPETGGDRETWITNRTEEIYRQKTGTMTGGAGTDEGAKPAKPAKYPNARWSDKLATWVVKKDDKWYRVN